MLLACKTPEELDISKLLAIYRSDSLENCRSICLLYTSDAADE